MKTRLEMRTEELEKIGTDYIDIVFGVIETANVIEITKLIKKINTVLTKLYQIKSLQYAKVEMSKRNYTFMSKYNTDDGILYLSLQAYLPLEIRNNIDETIKYLNLKLEEARKAVKYWTTPVYNFDEMIDNGKLYYKDDKGVFRKVTKS